MFRAFRENFSRDASCPELLRPRQTSPQVCILARECGVDFSDAGDIKRQSLVPEGNESNSVEEFLGSLDESAPEHRLRIASRLLRLQY